MEEAVNTYYGFRNMSPAERDALNRALRAKTPSQMAVKDAESGARFGNPACQTGQQSSRRPHCVPTQGRTDGLASRQSQSGNGGAQVRFSSFAELLQ